jgi:membrane protease YdiL (CAAX protease family)
LKLGHHPVCPPLNGGTLRSGLITFLIALPIVTAVNLGWIGVLKVCGLPVEQQDLLRMFSEASSPALLGLMIVLATLIAPLTEELLFRAVLFRYLRTRLPRWLALLLPGVIFASLHVDWAKLDGLASFGPLVTLAIVFSLAYERTGRIGTVVVAHALFNLHTILVLFTGPTE